MSDDRAASASRAGVAQTLTLGERLAAERAKRGPAGQLLQLPAAKDRLRQLEGPEDKLVQLSEVLPLMQQLLLGELRGRTVREDAHSVQRLDTNSAPLTNAEGHLFDMPTIFGGAPANSVRVWSVGGGNLEMNVNGQGWLPVAIGSTDRVENEVILSVRFRVTSGASGTAIVRFGAYTGDPLQT